MNRQNWDDVRFVLTVAQEGSLNAAAKKLGVTHATVMRRVMAFEARYARPIFRKAGSGYRVLPEAESILKAAGSVEDAFFAIERAILGSDQSLSGNVKIASTDSICQLVMPGALKSVSEAYPELTFTLLSANTHHDLSRMSADIAIRPTKALEDGLVGEVVGDLDFAVYGLAPEDDKWIGLKGPLRRSKPADWMDENVPARNVSHDSDSFLVIREMIAEGFGKAFLPRFIGDRDPRLKEIGLDGCDISVPVWIVALEDVSENARLQTVWKHIAEELRGVFVRRRSEKL